MWIKVIKSPSIENKKMHISVIKVSYGDEDKDWRIFVKKYELTKDYSMDRVKVVHLIGKAIWY